MLRRAAGTRRCHVVPPQIQLGFAINLCYFFRIGRGQLLPLSHINLSAFGGRPPMVRSRTSSRAKVVELAHSGILYTCLVLGLTKVHQFSLQGYKSMHYGNTQTATGNPVMCARCSASTQLPLQDGWGHSLYVRSGCSWYFLMLLIAMT